MAALVNQNENNKELYTSLFQKLSGERWLRSCKGSFSCKFSAIQYIIIHYLINKIGKGIVTEKNILTIIRLVMNAILQQKYKTDPYNKLYQIITNNGSSPLRAASGELFNYGTEITGIKSITDKIVYAGLVCPSYDNPNHLIINHYFLIVENNDGTFNIVSSYGSDDVSIMQSSIVLDTDEFDEFIRALKVIETEKTTRQYTIENSQEIIREFMKKYFLSSQYFRKTKVDPDNTGGRNTTNIRLIDKEIEIYATPPPGRGFHIDSYDIVPTLRRVIENELKEFSRSQLSSISEDNEDNEEMNMGGGNYKKYRTRKSKYRKSKYRKSKHRKSKYRKSKYRNYLSICLFVSHFIYI